MTCEEQLSMWVNGKSVHNEECDECCPDFSCCNPHMETSQEEKDVFFEAWKSHREDVIHGMLLMFLSKAFPSAHIAGFNYE